MGCASSHDLGTGPDTARFLKGKKKSSKALNSVENTEDISDQDLHRMKEQMLQRHDTEIDILTQLSVERTALRQMASGRIERKLSCEDLLDSLTANERVSLRESPHYQKLQKKYRLRMMKEQYRQHRKPWMIYNNLEAISETEISMLGVFLVNFLYALRTRRRERASSSAAVTVTEREREKEREREREKQRLENPFRLQLEKEFRSVPVITMAPAARFDIFDQDNDSSDVSVDYELPPGIITFREVEAVVELMRRGGKLGTRSLQKLLRLAYKHFKSQRNVSQVNVSENERLIVVGDIHGQLADLLHILDEAGLPSPTTKYIFNGDFVDRGEFGCEVMAILLVMMAAYPDAVFLNRGNHEDYAICSVYGFQVECYDKYDPLTFGMFVEIFQQIPLFALVNNAVFVVHGGLFHHADVTLAELADVRRDTFSLEELAESDESEAAPRLVRDRFLKQVARDALWSDPADSPGVRPSVRGAGVGFGPDVTNAFLATNGLQYVIRSHECVRSGYEEPHERLCTLFSASDYGGSGNSAAYLEMTMLSSADEESLSLPLSPSTRSIKTSAEKVARRRTLSFVEKESSDVENTSDLKRVPQTSLVFTVHYFFAAPLRFTTTRETLGVSAGVGSTLSSAGSNNSTNSHAHGTAGGNVLKDLAKEQLLTADSENDNDNMFLSAVDLQSFSSSKRDLNGSSVNIGKRNILVGSASDIEELIWTRKVNLLEAMDQHAQEWRDNRHDSDEFQTFEYTKDALPFADFVRILSEILNVSLAWKRCVMLLIREEDKCFGPPQNTSSVTQDALEVDAERRREQERTGDFLVYYKRFLDRYDDEVTSFVKRKEEEASRATMDVLQHYLDSLNPSEGAPNSNGNNGSSAPLSDNMIELHMTDDASDEVLPMRALMSSLSEIDGDPRYFHGLIISDLLVHSLYANCSQLESAFALLDANQDGYFDESDFRRVCVELQLVDHASSNSDSESTSHKESVSLSANRSTKSTGSGLKLLHMPAHLSSQSVDDAQLFALLDVQQCGEVDINVFFEMCRLSVLNSLHPEDAASRPQMARENSVNAETRRLTHSSSSATLLTLATGASQLTHTPSQLTLTSVELKKGVEIGVDAELAPVMTSDSKKEQVGLDI